MNLYLLLYSFSQNCYHIERINETIETNLDALVNGIPNDYIVVAATKTEAEMDVAKAKIYELFPKTGVGNGP